MPFVLKGKSRVFHFGHYSIERIEDRGRFHCPDCNEDRSYSLARCWNYLHVFFIPIGKDELLGERIVCDHCTQRYPITVLGRSACAIGSAYESGVEGEGSVSDTIGNIVELTEAACDEVKLRHARGQFPPDVVTRIEPDTATANYIKVTFDIPVADGRDWLGESQGIPIVISRRVAPQIQGCTVDFVEGEFVRVR